LISRNSELASYHAASGSSSATYLITGEVIPVRKVYGDRMDVDGEEYDEDEDDEDDEYGVLPETRVLLVSEEKFECESFPPFFYAGL
jgi:hypothetical protein